MKTSDSITSLAPALLAAQADLKHAPRSATNPHYKSTYAPLDVVIDTVKPALAKHGLVVLQTTSETNGECVTVTTRMMHSSGEWIEGDLTLRPVKPDPQGIGSCITYARRYALAAICCIAGDEDDDANSASNATPAKSDKQVDKKHEAALELFRKVWSTYPGEKTINNCALFLPLVAKWEDVKAQSTAALLEAVDKINAVIEEAK